MRTSKQQRYDRFRAKENASKYHWDRMNKEEKKWLIAFDASEYEVERGHINEAINLLTAQDIIPREKYINDMESRREDFRKSNPITAALESKAKRKYDNYQGIRAPKSNTYDVSDFVRVMPGKILKDDLGYTPPFNEAEVQHTASSEPEHTDSHLADKIYKPFKVEAGLNPDETAVMINPEDGMIAAIDAARAKGNRSLEKLIEDAKLSKEAKEDLLARTQTMTYTGMTYTLHGTQFMNLNYILQARNGQLYVQDQHDRIQTLALYLKRHTADSYATHAIVSYPSQPIQTWVFKAGHRSNVEGSAIQWAI